MIPRIQSRRTIAVLSALVLAGGAVVIGTPAAIATQAAPKMCYEKAPSGSAFGDGRLTGPINTFENFTLYASTDGTCTAPLGLGWTFTVVKANNYSTAVTVCGRLGFLNADSFARLYPKVPANWYECNFTGG